MIALCLSPRCAAADSILCLAAICIFEFKEFSNFLPLQLISSMQFNLFCPLVNTPANEKETILLKYFNNKKFILLHDHNRIMTFVRELIVYNFNKKLFKSTKMQIYVVVILLTCFVCSIDQNEHHINVLISNPFN